jgi:hypothetical protein
MKKSIFTLCLSATILAACSDNISENANTHEGQGGCVIALQHEFEYEDGTRVSLNRTDKGMTCTWKDGDHIGVFPVSPEDGSPAMKTIKATDVYQDAHFAEFRGEGWMLDTKNKYAAFYPLNTALNADVAHNAIPVDMNGQTQSGNDNTDHIADYDFMYAPSTFAKATDDTGMLHTVAFNFNHAVAIIELSLRHKPTFYAKWSKVTLTNDNGEEVFTSTATINAATGELTPLTKSASVTLSLDNIETSYDNPTLTLYMAVLPTQLSNITLTLVSVNGIEYSAPLPAKELLAGKIYKFSADKFTTPTYGYHNGHKWVYFGSKSGIRWAVMNVGASSPSDYGKYYAWGETCGYGEDDYSNETNYKYAKTYCKTEYSVNTYKHCNGSWYTITKYCNNATYGYRGFVDNKINLDPEDDAANVNWGGAWHIPYEMDFSELEDECYVEYTDNYNNTGVTGYTYYLAKCDYDKGKYKLTKEGNPPSCTYTLDDTHIFFPCAGYHINKDLIDEKKEAFYATNKASTVPYRTRLRILISSYFEPERSIGVSVRAIIDIK